MHIVNNTSIFLLIFLVIACNNSKVADPKAKENQVALNVVEEVAEITDTRNTILLQGGYSTSSQAGNEWFNLFDDDPASNWQSKLGTGPGEKIGISFLNEGVWVSNLVLARLGRKVPPLSMRSIFLSMASCTLSARSGILFGWIHW